ncbi:unnamed protein product [Protopolystoma xenopodis]|uniref:Uncharacterized protein n=1 Tax=Protopolystoma xenopodis TaxID=117903 RepID=A0A448WF19_9PLAT|nr:unnamed protein product [Protopolystoma xenopodis]
MSSKSTSLQVGFVKLNHRHHQYEVRLAGVLTYNLPPFSYPAGHMVAARHQDHYCLEFHFVQKNIKKRFKGRSHRKREVESHCTAAVWLLYDVEIDAFHKIPLFSGKNELSFRPSYDRHHQLTSSGEIDIPIFSSYNFIRNESPNNNVISGDSSKPSYSPCQNHSLAA